MTGGSRWFRRFLKDCKKISPHLRVKAIKHGFYRIYWKQAYVHEVYKEMPQHGHDIEEANMNFENRKYIEEYEDRIDLIRNIKNYKEGYWDALDTVRTRVYMLLNNKEFHDQAVKRYQTVTIK